MVTIACYKDYRSYSYVNDKGQVVGIPRLGFINKGIKGISKHKTTCGYTFSNTFTDRFSTISFTFFE